MPFCRCLILIQKNQKVNYLKKIFKMIVKWIDVKKLIKIWHVLKIRKHKIIEKSNNKGIHHLFSKTLSQILLFLMKIKRFVFILWIKSKNLDSIEVQHHFHLILIFCRVAIGSDRKQFLSSDSTKNKNESDPIRRKNEKLNPI